MISEQAICLYQKPPLLITLINQSDFKRVCLFIYAENTATLDSPFNVTIPTSYLITKGGTPDFMPQKILAIHIGIQATGFAFAQSFAIKRIYFE